MGRRHCAALALLLLLGATRPADGDPVTLTTRYSADPSPYVDPTDDRLYITATHDEDGARCFCNHDYNVFSTLDGVNWRDDGVAFSPTRDTAWARNAWAQQVVWHAASARYLMFFPGL